MCTVVFVVWLFQNMTHYSTCMWKHTNTVTVIFCGCSLMACEYAYLNVLAQARRECGGPSRSDIISGCWATQTQTHAHTPTHTWAAGLEWLCSKGCRLWLTPWTWHPHCPGHHMSPRHTLLAQKNSASDANEANENEWKWILPVRPSRHRKTLQAYEFFFNFY